ncbi:MAG: hypothetical protein WAN65_31685 [Candidatus Sulfotelmatobacter sp.]
MNYYLKGSIALGLLGTLVYAEVQGENHPHAQYMAGSTANNLVASGGYVSNVSASVVTYTYTPSPVVLENLLPHDRLMIQDAALTPPTVKLVRSLPATGANPFFERRQRAPRLEVQSPKVRPFWCASFQKFRGRMVT